MIRSCCARSAPTRSSFSALLGRAPSPHIRLALLCIRAYQVLLSPYVGGSCRFLPSCSAYAAEAIATHGLARGGWLSVKRLVRCHPLCAAGHDPVPRGRVSESIPAETRSRLS